MTHLSTVAVNAPGIYTESLVIFLCQLEILLTKEKVAIKAADRMFSGSENAVSRKFIFNALSTQIIHYGCVRVDNI